MKGNIIEDLSLRFFGMQRSGNHAIISWFIANVSPTDYIFFNNCEPWKCPEKSFTQVEVNGYRFRRSQLRDQNPIFAAGLSEFPTLCVVSYENFIPSRKSDLKNISNLWKDKKFDQEYVVIRSFLNWLSSLSRLYRRNDIHRSKSDLEREVDILSAVVEYTKALRFLSIIKFLPNTKIVLFDEWAASKSYRRHLLHDLGVLPKTSNWNYVPPYGGGSSFDEPGTKGEDLRVNERWRMLAEDPKNREIVKIAMGAHDFAQLLESVFPEDYKLANSIF